MMRRWLLLIALFIMAIPVMAQDTDADNNFPPPHYATDETFALVVYPRVNLRTAPDTITGVVVDIARLGDRYRIVRLSQDERWYLIETGGGRAWIDGDSVIVANPDEVPLGNEPSPELIQRVNEQVAYVTNTVGVRGALRIRSGPGTSYSIIGLIPATGRIYVQGRNYYGTWVYMNYNGVLGWVSGYHLAFPPGYRLDLVPVVR